jgi:hypothetical protein
MASLTKSVPLQKPFPGAEGIVSTVIVREPSGSEYLQLGEPKTWVRAAGGMALVENDDVIRKYVERCIVKPDPLLALNQLSLKDMRAVRDAVLGFFSEEESTEATTTSAPDSSLITSS